MKLRIYILLLMTCSFFLGNSAVASDPSASELKCASDAGSFQNESGVCFDPGSINNPSIPDGSLLLLLMLPNRPEATDQSSRDTAEKIKTTVYFFWGRGCPHCEEEKTFLDQLKRNYPSLEIRDYEVWYNKQNAGLLATMMQKHGVRSYGVPVTFVADQYYSGFSAQSGSLIEKTIKESILAASGDDSAGMSMKSDHSDQTATSVKIPLVGVLDADNSSLPVLTLAIAGMDSFNPCAFFVLLSLLGLLVHAQSRKKMLLIGGIFVFFSGLIYFLFMAAWLNLFLVMGHIAAITTVAGSVSVVIAAINIKDFFLYKQGLSLTIADSAKPKLFDRMRKLLRSGSLASILIGATVLAVVANFYELLCTAGFPMVFTRILTLNNLSTTTYYLYLVLYNIVYVIPLLIIVLGFTVTLGKRQLSEWQGRVLKLVSGSMMLGLGAVLLVNPALLNSVMVSFIILLSALGVSLLVATVTRRIGIINQ